VLQLRRIWANLCPVFVPLSAMVRGILQVRKRGRGKLLL
jgi:hypothetical protein